MLGANQFRFIGGNEPKLLAEYLNLPFLPAAQPPNPETVMADAAANGICVVKFSLKAGADFTGLDLVGVGNSPTKGDGGNAFDLFWQNYNKEPDHGTYFHALDALISDAKETGTAPHPNLVNLIHGLGLPRERHRLLQGQ